MWRYFSTITVLCKGLIKNSNGSTLGICAGKNSIADFLVYALGFQRVSLRGSDAELQGTHQNRDLSSDSVFDDVDKLLEFITPRWRQRWVFTNTLYEDSLEKLLLRPFFLLISVDAPIKTRWERCRTKCENTKKSLPSFKDFVIQNDEQMFDAEHGLARLLDQAQLRLLNSSNSLNQLYEGVRALNLSNEQRLRPSWDEYFMRLADLAAERSNCMKRRVGCVVVRDKRVISTGYNGTPRNVTNCNEGGCEFQPSRRL